MSRKSGRGPRNGTRMGVGGWVAIVAELVRRLRAATGATGLPLVDRCAGELLPHLGPLNKSDRPACLQCHLLPLLADHGRRRAKQMGPTAPVGCS